VLRLLTVRSRVAAAAVLAVVLLGSCAAVLLTLIHQRDAALREQTQVTLPLVRAVTELSQAVTSEARGLPAAQTARTRTDGHLSGLRAFPAGAPLRSATVRWRALAGSPGRDPAAAQGAYATLRRELRVQQLIAWQADEQAARRVARTRDALTLTLTLFLGAAMLLVLGLFLAVRDWTTRPLRHLAGVVRELALGELSRPVLLGGPQEFRHMGEQLDVLRRATLVVREEGSRAREALAQAPQVLSALGEKLAPTVPRDVAGVSVGVAYRPAEGVVAGDWCDVSLLGKGLLGLSMVDVAGHGADPGLVALQTKQLMISALLAGLEPARCVESTARQTHLAEETTLTAMVAILNPLTGSLRYCNAGHPDVLVRSQDGTYRRLRSNGSMLSGLGGSWETDEVLVRLGDLVVAVTDGVLEARNLAGEHHGEDGVRKVLDRLSAIHPPVPAQEVAEEVLLVARRHSGGVLTDDATVLAVRMLSPTLAQV
jgi:HAMP domain-containing protein